MGLHGLLWRLCRSKAYFTREIDIAKLSSTIECISPEKSFLYYGHYKPHPELPIEHPLNLKYRKSLYRITKARAWGFTTRTKEIKEINNLDEDGKFLGTINKCNFDVEITMDVITKIEKYDTVFL
jgi:hypothetical protein